MGYRFAIAVLFWAVTGFAAAQLSASSTTFTAKFEGEGITSSKGLGTSSTGSSTSPTSTPQVAGKKCCADNIPEQFLYNDVCFCRLFPAEQANPLLGLKLTQVVPSSPKNLAVYNPLYFSLLGSVNPPRAEISVRHRLEGKYRTFDLKRLCYACETPLKEGNTNEALPGNVVIKGYDGNGNEKGTLDLPFKFTLGGKMQCKDINQGQAFQEVARISLQCVVAGTVKVVTTVIDDVVLVLHDE